MQQKKPINSQQRACHSRNLVAKHARTFQQSAFHKDKKAALKRGDRKTKHQQYYLSSLFNRLFN